MIRQIGRYIVENIKNTLKFIFENFKSVLLIFSLITSIIIFVFQLRQLEPRVSNLEVKIAEMQESNRIVHDTLKEKLLQTEEDFKIVGTKLETSLSQISVDLQYIKQKLMEKSFK